MRQDSLSFVPGVGDLVTCETRNHSLMEGRVDKVNSGQLHVLFSDDGTRSWVRSSDVKVVKKVSQAEFTDPMQVFNLVPSSSLILNKYQLSNSTVATTRF